MTPFAHGFSKSLSAQTDFGGIVALYSLALSCAAPVAAQFDFVPRRMTREEVDFRHCWARLGNISSHAAIGALAVTEMLLRP